MRTDPLDNFGILAVVLALIFSFTCVSVAYIVFNSPGFVCKKS